MNAVIEGVDVAMSIAPVSKPWVMISINDDQADVHFRKAGPDLHFLSLTLSLS